MSTKPGSTERLQVAGIPQPLYAALQRIADREGKTMSRAGLDALEAFAAGRGEWPPGREGPRPAVGVSAADIAWATEQVMAVLERREEPPVTAFTIPQKVRGADLNITIGDKLPVPLRVTVSRHGQPQRLYIARDEVVKVLRATHSYEEVMGVYIPPSLEGATCSACGACRESGDPHADDCALVAFCEANGIALSEVEGG